MNFGCGGRGPRRFLSAENLQRIRFVFFSLLRHGTCHGCQSFGCFPTGVVNQN